MEMTGTLLTFRHGLMVALLGAVVAFWVLPSSGEAPLEARREALDTFVQNLQLQIAVYKTQHEGRDPLHDANGVEDPDNLINRLTSPTDVDGTLNPSGACGPYLMKWPANPLCDETVAANVEIGNTLQIPHSGSSGWYFSRTNCQIYSNSKTGGERFDP